MFLLPLSQVSTEQVTPEWSETEVGDKEEVTLTDQRDWREQSTDDRL